MSPPKTSFVTAKQCTYETIGKPVLQYLDELGISKKPEPTNIMELPPTLSDTSPIKQEPTAKIEEQKDLISEPKKLLFNNAKSAAR